MSSPEAYAAARQSVDDVHRKDPAQLELAYADAMEAWVKKLHDAPSEILLLAARCQHLDRFSTPRATYPEGKAGYLRWRRDLYTIQSELAQRLLLAAEIDPSEADSVGRWVAKDNLNLKNSADPLKRARVEEGTQVLEDAAVLVFLEKELEDFVVKIQGGEGFEREKWVDILRKTWKKLSAKGQEAALSIAPNLPQALQDIMTDAVTSTAETTS